MTFDEIVNMIVKSTNTHFYSGAKDVKGKVLECATQIYIEQNKNKDKEGEAE